MVTLKGNELILKGNMPDDQAPDFLLVNQKLERLSLSAFEGKIKVLNIFPSIDTQVCAHSIKEFQERITNSNDLVLLHISMDLPFAQKRFCLAEKQQEAHTLSAFDSSFGEDYGVLIENGPMKGLFARAVFILNAQNKMIYHELVSEISEEPNYGQALENLENYLKPKL
ncbi:MAG: Thiol peroxidase [Chlamydiae bacterium]|nr:Thiol peroxidase [Chlamydiota bacterium]